MAATNLRAKFDQLKSQVEEKEKSDFVNPPTDIDYTEAKQLAGRYPSFRMNCNDLLRQVQALKDEDESADNAEEGLRGECNDLIQRIDDLLECSFDSQEQIKQKRVTFIKGILRHLMDELAILESEINRSSKRITPDSSKYVVAESITACQDLVKTLSDLQTSVRTACTTVDGVYTDKTLPKATRKDLRTDATNLLVYYAKVLESSQVLQGRLNGLYVQKVKEMFTGMNEKVHEIEMWVTEGINQHENSKPSYGSYYELAQLESQNKTFRNSVEEAWGQFEAITEEWNRSLSDEVKDDEFTKRLIDLQANFEQLRGITSSIKTSIKDMLSQKQNEDDLSKQLLAWKSFVNDREGDLRSLSVEPGKLTTHTLIEIFNLRKNMENENEHVHDFIEELRNTLKINTYDEQEVDQIEEELKDFEDQWRRVKEQTRLTEEESQGNLDEKMKKMVERYNVLQGQVSELHAGIKEVTNLFGDLPYKYWTHPPPDEIELQVTCLLNNVRDNSTSLEDIVMRWRSDLSVDIDDKSYSNSLKEFETEFINLNSISNVMRSMINHMLRQKRTEDELHTKLVGWKSHVNGKEDKLKELSVDPGKFHTQIEAIVKDMNEKDVSVQNFLEEANDVIGKNKYDEQAVEEMEESVRVFCDQWEQFKQKAILLKHESDRIMAEIQENIEDRFNVLKAIVTDIDTWLTDITLRYGNQVVEYGTYLNLKEINSLNKHWMKEIAETWKRFELIAEEWNNGLCEEVSDETYADVLLKVQTKFVTLNKVANDFKKLVSKMLRQKKVEDGISVKLEGWMSYTERMKTDLGTMSGNPEKFHAQIKDIIKDVNEKEEPVEIFLKDASEDLEKNRFDERAVEEIRSKMNEFCTRWEELKYLAVYIQKEIEETLIARQQYWKKVQEDFLFRIDNYDVDDHSSIPALANAINDVEALIAEVYDVDGNVTEFNRNSIILMNVLQPETESELNPQLQSFFTQWEELKGRCISLLSEIKSQYEKLIENEKQLMDTWEEQFMITDEWLDNVCTGIEVFTDPELDDKDFSDKEFEIHQARLDKLDNRVNTEKVLVEEAVENGMKLIDGDELKLKENKETVSINVGDIQLKQSKLNEKISLVKKKMDELIDKRSLQKRNEEELELRSAIWNQKLQDVIDTLDRCEIYEKANIHSHPEHAINMLEVLIDNIESNDEELNKFGAHSRELTEALPKEKANALNIGFQLFFKCWNHCKENAIERLTTLKLKMSQLKKHEEHIMNEWIDKVLEIMSRLDDAEKELSSFDSFQENIEDTKTFVIKFVVFSNKMQDIDDSIVTQKDIGVELLESRNIQLSDNVKQIQGDIQNFDTKLEYVTESISTTKKQIEDIVEKVIQQKIEDFNHFIYQCNVKLDSCYVEGTSQIEKAAAIKVLEELSTEIKEEDGSAIMFDMDSKVLIDDIQHRNSVQLILQLQYFFNQWEKLKETIGLLLSRLKSQYEKYLEDEERLMQSWKVKHTATEEWLDNVCTEIEVFAAPDTEFDDYENYLSELDKLEDKVNTERVVVEESIDVGDRMVDGGELRLQENKDTVRSVVDVFKVRKTKVQESLQLAKTKLLDGRERRRIQNENEDSARWNIAQWEGILQIFIITLEKSDEINDASNISDILEAITTLKSLTKEMTSYDGALNKFESVTQELIDSLPEDKSSALMIELGQFMKKWGHSKDTSFTRLDLLSSKMDQIRTHESNLINEWDTKTLMIMSCLEDIDKELSTFTQFPEHVNDIKTSVMKYEELPNKVTDIEETIAVQKEFGVGMVKEKEVQLYDNVEKIYNDIAILSEKLEEVSENMTTTWKFIILQVQTIMLQQNNDCRAWMPKVEQIREENELIGPDIETLSNQIKQIELIQSQALDFSEFLSSERLLEFLTEGEAQQLGDTNDELMIINVWINELLLELQQSRQIWDEFERSKTGIVDYLRNVEHILDAPEGLDWTEPNTFRALSKSFYKVTADMESRKDLVDNLLNTSDQLVGLVSTGTDLDEDSAAFDIRSFVMEILDLWNLRVKQSIELRTILHASRDKFEVMKKIFGEVRAWISSFNVILNQFTNDTIGKDDGKLRELLEEKQKEEEGMKKKLDHINTLDTQLSQNGELASQYSLQGSVITDNFIFVSVSGITELNRDFDAVSRELERFRTFREKARLLSRRLSGSTRRLFKNDAENSIGQQPVEVLINA